MHWRDSLNRWLPSLLLVGMGGALISFLLDQSEIANWWLVITIGLGSSQLLQQTWQALRQGRWALDYIALTAIVIGVATGQFWAAAVICLMLAGGHELEAYAQRHAKFSLTALAQRLPTQVQLWQSSQPGPTTKVTDLQVGQQIVLRHGEVIPVDGRLVSVEASIDEASLRGEAGPIKKLAGDRILSGTVNAGNQLILTVTTTGAESTYQRILALVAAAQQHKSPLIRLADRYSGWFTLITFGLAGLAWWFSGSVERALAVFVMATPCPLILATPIALLGGLQALAQRRIIVKNLASLEQLARITDIVFDKTGTLTLGELVVTRVSALTSAYSQSKILALAAALEQNSLHPIAKTLLQAAKAAQLTLPAATHLAETTGQGVTGTIEGTHYALARSSSRSSTLVLTADGHSVGEIELADQLKNDSRTLLPQLQSLGFKLHLLSGDEASRVTALLQTLHLDIPAQAECTPTAKTDYIHQLQHHGARVAMVGDGINDAPALATANVGIVFSHDEASAASEAADVVLTTNQLTALTQLLTVAKATVAIAVQSIWLGMGLSLLGMLAASAGLIPPITGALLQEVIDVLVIIYALKASKQ